MQELPHIVLQGEYPVDLPNNLDNSASLLVLLEPQMLMSTRH